MLLSQIKVGYKIREHISSLKNVFRLDGLVKFLVRAVMGIV